MTHQTRMLTALGVTFDMCGVEIDLDQTLHRFGHDVSSLAVRPMTTFQMGWKY